MLGVWRGEKKDQALFAWRIVVRVNRIPNGAARGFRSPRDSTMNGRGGKRPGAGRPRGAASRANDEVRQEAAATGELPLAYMLRIMRDPSQQGAASVCGPWRGDRDCRVLVATKVDTAEVPTVLLLRLLLAFGSSKIF